VTNGCSLKRADWMTSAGQFDGQGDHWTAQKRVLAGVG